MPRTKSVCGVVVRELTLEELRCWLENSVNRQSLSAVDLIFVDKQLLVSDIPDFSDADTDRLEKFAPSQLDEIVDAILEVNERFFASLRRLAMPAQVPVSD